MPSYTITSVTTRDVRYQLADGEGADAIHQAPRYSYAVADLDTGAGLHGIGLAFTLGGGNDLVCRAIEYLGESLVGAEIEELMADFGTVFRSLADHHQLRWLGPHKGVIHLALASLVNACFDLWAKSRGVPLWKLLIDLSPAEVVALCDLSYLEEVLTPDEARGIMEREHVTRHNRESVLRDGYPGYDTSVGWFHYSDDRIRDNARAALDRGFTAMKLKVGSEDISRDVRRATIVREVVGDRARLMFDANQQWTLPRAREACSRLREVDPYWVEEPTHPDDVLGHRELADIVPIALGEHVPNRIVFKNYLQAGCAAFIQPDCVRIGGVSEFLTVSLLARKFGVPVVPHVGDMGQIHQHLVLFNRVALGHEAVFLEYIPHLRERFVHPAEVEDGVYRVPQEAGSSSDLW